MGIRIRKELGYVLTDLKCDKDGRIVDERINPLGWLMADCEDQDATWTLEGWLAYAKHHLDDFDWHWEHHLFGAGKKRPEKVRSWEPYDYVIHDSEFGIPEVLLVRPTMGSDGAWSRFDNLIDHCEQSMRYRGLKNLIEPLDFPIFPYDGYMDATTGERLTDRGEDRRGLMVREMWYLFRSAEGIKGSRFRDRERRKSWREMAGRIAVDVLKCESLEAAQQRYVPIVPDVAQALARYLCLFNDDATIYQLRPAIYTFWR